MIARLLTKMHGRTFVRERITDTGLLRSTTSMGQGLTQAQHRSYKWAAVAENISIRAAITLSLSSITFQEGLTIAIGGFHIFAFSLLGQDDSSLSSLLHIGSLGIPLVQDQFSS